MKNIESDFNLLEEKVKEHCIELRLDVDLATETAIHDMHWQRDELIQKIDDYKAKTIAQIQTEKKAREEFQQTFNSKTGEVVGEKEVKRANELALALNKEVELRRKQLNAFVFDKERICFEKHLKTGDMNNLGVIRFKRVDGYDMSEFMRLDISDIFKGGVILKLKIYPQVDGSYYIL